MSSETSGNTPGRTKAGRRVVRLAALLAAVATAVPLAAGQSRQGQPALAAPTSLGVNLDQCANQVSPCTWQNGDLNGNNSQYAEDRVVPFRLAIEGLTPGLHTIQINYDFTAAGRKAYDFLARYNASETVDLCAPGGGGVSSLCQSLLVESTYPFPSDP